MQSRLQRGTVTMKKDKISMYKQKEPTDLKLQRTF